MLEADISLLKQAAYEAADIAKHHWRGSYQTWDKAEGAGPVTEADLAIDAQLRTTLRRARPDYGWLSEETEDDAARLEAEECFIIDPLDGTRSFIAGDSHWAHSLAIASQGDIRAAVVYLPIIELMFYATKHGGAFCNDAPISVENCATADGAKIMGARPAFSPEHWKHGAVPDINKRFRPSLAYRMALIAQGRYDGMITFRDTWEWDIAAGSLLIQEAGGIASDRHGTPLTFNNRHPATKGVIAANATLHADLRDRLVY